LHIFILPFSVPVESSAGSRHVFAQVFRDFPASLTYGDLWQRTVDDFAQRLLCHEERLLLIDSGSAGDNEPAKAGTSNP